MNPVKVYDLTLANVAVSDVAVTNAADSDSLEYSLSLDYSKIALVTNGIDGSGQANRERRVRLRRHQPHRDRPVLTWLAARQRSRRRRDPSISLRLMA